MLGPLARARALTLAEVRNVAFRDRANRCLDSSFPDRECADLTSTISWFRASSALPRQGGFNREEERRRRRARRGQYEGGEAGEEQDWREYMSFVTWAKELCGVTEATFKDFLRVADALAKRMRGRDELPRRRCQG